MKEAYLSYYQIVISERVKSNGKDPVTFKPNMVSIDDNCIRFGMFKHYGVLTLPVNSLFCKN